MTVLKATSSGHMRAVILALVPGITAMGWFFGPGVFLNTLLAIIACLAGEALVLVLRKRPLTPLGDGSAILTAILLALCLPPDIPYWLPICSGFLGIVLAKQLYGGLGQNLFNPAMVAYAMALLAWPALLAEWPSSTPVDGLSMATPLEASDIYLSEYATLEGFSSPEQASWVWINLMFLVGGLWLCAKKTADYRIALSVTVGLGLAALIGDLLADTLAGPEFHLLSGASMLCAFFIATDPATAPADKFAKILFGFMIGVLIFCIRSWGAYPDGVAFAVLLANLSAPLFDRLFQRKQPSPL